MNKVDAIYIHIPFCKIRCSYCSFYSLRTSIFKNIDSIYSQFTQNLQKELLLYADQFKKNLFKTIFIGGGTPSILPRKWLQSIFETLFKNYQFSSNLEFTIEVNPESVSEDHLKLYKNYSVNRISMGCQTFHNPTLIAINRETSKKEIIQKYFLLRKYGFTNINLDFIFGLWNQPTKQYQKDLRIAVELDPEHISTYGLTLDRKDLKKKCDQKEIILPNEEEVIKNYLYTINFLEKNHYIFYEVSNFAKKGKKCRHNLIYWSQKNYLALGPSAVGTIQKRRYKNLNLNSYIKNLKKGQYPIQNIENLTKKDQINEKIILSLRQKKGLNIKSICWEKNEDYSNFINKINFYQNLNLLKVEKDLVKLKKDGFLVLDTILSNLIN